MSNPELIEAQVVEVAKETLKASENNRLTDARDAVECAPRLRRKVLATRSLTTESSNSCGCLWCQTEVNRLSATQVTPREIKDVTNDC